MSEAVDREEQERETAIQSRTDISVGVAYDAVFAATQLEVVLIAVAFWLHTSKEAKLEEKLRLLILRRGGLIYAAATDTQSY